MMNDDYFQQLSIDGNWSPELRRKYVRDINQISKDKCMAKDSERQPQKVLSNDEAFIKAASEGQLKLLLNLISKVSINSQNSKGQTALIAASMGGHTTSVQFLLAKQANRELYDESGCSAYHYACLKDDPVVLKILLEKGNPNNRNRAGQTILHLAVKYEKYKVLDFLLSSEKININEKDADENTSAHIAVMEKNTKVLMKLVSIPQINLSLFNKNGFNPINLAIYGNDIESLNILMTTSEGTRLLMSRTQYKESNFQIAVRLKFTTIVEYLMNIKNVNLITADIDDKYGYTCLHWATLQINKDLVDKILNANQKVINVKDKTQKTALEHIVNIYEQSKILQKDIIEIAMNLLIHNADHNLVMNRLGYQKIIKEICLIAFNK